MVKILPVMTIALALGGCDLTVRDTWRPVTPAADVASLRMRRVQVLTELERLERIQRRQVIIENRVAVGVQITRLNDELALINAALGE